MIHWEKLLAHSHWITLHAFGREVRLCARCSGIVLGFIASRIAFLQVTSGALPVHTGLPVSLLLALPSIVDWTTQNLGFRQSTNNIRLATGFLEGLGVALLTHLAMSPLLRLLILTGIGLSVVSVGFLGRELAKRYLSTEEKPAPL